MSFLPCMFFLNEVHACNDELWIGLMIPAAPQACVVVLPIPFTMDGCKPVECEEYILESPKRTRMATEGATLGVFSEDFNHFEKSHDAFPVEAQKVLDSIAELRAALGSFRQKTENICVMDDTVARLLIADEEDAAAPTTHDESATPQAEPTPLAEATLDSPKSGEQ